jgi:4-aminobutyrate aminotransferase
LRDIQGRYPVLGDVRGLGLMIGVEFTLPDGSPGTDLVKRVIGQCLDSKLLLLNCGTYNNVLRWIPPLIVTREQIETALGIFEQSLARAV